MTDNDESPTPFPYVLTLYMQMVYNDSQFQYIYR